MDKELLKKLLRDQFEPMSIAVSEKLTYLQSDNVFTDNAAAGYGLADNRQADEEDMINKAFALSEKANGLPVQPTETPARRPVETTVVAAPSIENSEPATPISESTKHRLIAEKIAALRGISIDSDYYKRKS